VVFYGANDLAEIAFTSLKAFDIKLAGVVDDLKKGEKYLDYTIKSIAELSKLKFERIIITTIDSKETVFNELLEKGIPRKKIIMLE
jgi:hypothetical protein